MQDGLVAARSQKLAVLFDEGRQNGRHEGRSRAVAGHVGEVETREAVAERKVIDEIAAQELRGKKPPKQR